MKLTRNILTLMLLSAGLSFAGVYEKNVVTPAPLCGPWYMSLFGGGSFFDDGSWTGEFGDTANFGLDSGWIAGVAIGVRTKSDWRFELEGTQSEGSGQSGSLSINDSVAAYTIDGGLLAPLAPIPLVGEATSGLRGDIERTSLMLNIAKEFPALAIGALRPYLGAGIGLTKVRTDLRMGTTVTIPGDDAAPLGGLVGIDDHYYGDEVVLGYQAMAGFVLDITECLQLYLEYRLTGCQNPQDVSRDRSITDLSVPGADVASIFDTTRGEFGSLDLGWAQNAIIGVRWFF